MARIKEIYQKEVVPQLLKEFGYKNVMQVPRIEKIVLNMGIGAEVIQNSKVLESANADLTAISGQKPALRRSKKSIANFKLREGLVVGLKVTLRGSRMYEFFDRLVNAALPRIRDFKGISGKAFDGSGNYTLGVKEQIIFPEIVYDKIDKLRGMNITIVTTAKNDEEGKTLLKFMGVPFRN
ncbi:MAG: 50S ribosomal protein L5 [Candidatus Schekmanbacteria bacterium]|nr:50S ribosomal protein L5 [Candidatus Schekmanbacteria bacterium]